MKKIKLRKKFLDRIDEQFSNEQSVYDWNRVLNVIVIFCQYTERIR